MRTHKIPNWLTFPAAALGILMQCLYFASYSTGSDLVVRLSAGLLTGCSGWFCAVFVMTLTKFFLKKMGHGDTKLMAALGSFFGPGLVFIIYLYYSLSFGLFSLGKMVSAIPWNEMWLAQEMKKVGAPANPVDFQNFNAVRKAYLPVGPFIAIGAILTYILKEPTLTFLGFNK